MRVAPGLSNPATIRVEPSAYISNEDLDRFVAGMEMFCLAVIALDVTHLTAYQV